MAVQDQCGIELVSATHPWRSGMFIVKIANYEIKVLII